MTRTPRLSAFQTGKEISCMQRRLHDASPGGILLHVIFSFIWTCKRPVLHHVRTHELINKHGHCQTMQGNQSKQSAEVRANKEQGYKNKCSSQSVIIKETTRAACLGEQRISNNQMAAMRTCVAQCYANRYNRVCSGKRADNMGHSNHDNQQQDQ